ncbi:hypothetical protein HGA92_01700 [Candidatus Gracilibacteria bacterium]|nr:hypothetical protein [Candidatus Gracilibacteria bacterium]
MKYKIWYSTESFADYIIDNTILNGKNISKSKMYESDANNSANFHTLPDHIKKILYLDAPDIIVEFNSEPIFSIEVSTEAGTGHNAFQRFARLAASVENNVPAFYIYPEAAIITRKDSLPKWDKINPLIFKALNDVMSIYKIPAVLYYFPSDYRLFPNDASSSPNLMNKGLKFDTRIDYAGSPEGTDGEMISMFNSINEIIQSIELDGIINGREKLLSKRTFIDRCSIMNREFIEKGGSIDSSPITATKKIPTEYLLNYLSNYEDSNYKIGNLLKSRNETIIYQVDAKFRGDPYPGALAALDYLLCREGKTFEDRKYNLILAWGEVIINNENKSISINSNKASIEDFTMAVKASENKNILNKNYTDLKNSEISRYYMQVRYGSTFSKVKHIRVYSYFADGILFNDGALWRDA